MRLEKEESQLCTLVAWKANYFLQDYHMYARTRNRSNITRVVIISDFLRKRFRISLVFWATELDTTLSSSICQPASINKSSSGNRARYGFIEVDISTGLDELIDLGKPSSICRYRARIVEDGEARTLTFPGGQVECYRAR